MPNIDGLVWVDVSVLLALGNAVFVEMRCEFCMRDRGAINQFDVAEKPFGAALSPEDNGFRRRITVFAGG